MTKSVWHLDAQSPGYSSNKRNADVIIIGAGLTGLLAAWQLIQEGKDVLLLEARRIGDGTSGHTTGKITSQHGIFYHDLLKRSPQKAKVYAQSNQWAVDAYRQLITQEQIDCQYLQQSAYIYSNQDTDILEDEYGASLELGLPSSLESIPHSPNKALCFSGQAQFHSVKFMLGLAQKIIQKGGVIAEGSRIIEVEEKNDRCIVKTKDQHYEAGYVMFATLFPILDHSIYSVRLKPELHHGLAYSYAKKEFEGMYWGINDLSFRYSGDYLIVIGGDYRVGDVPKSGDPYVKLDRLARARFSIKEEKARWSAHDLMSPDLIPFIGKYHSTSKRSFCATGFKAWGITHAMIAAKMFSDFISSRTNPWEDLFAPSRMDNAFPTIVKQGQVAVKQLIKGGKRCSHMGCGLVFNEYDRTYDCPCHGSRFDEHGNVLWGPATKSI